MRVFNNAGALNILNTMNRNTKSSNKATTKVATGEKFNSAGLGSASDYKISESLRAKIRGLDQCNINSGNGQAMINIAEKAVGSQVEILKKVRTIAMKASDDTYTDVDRKALQDEVTHLLDELDDIAHATNYNGISLLDQREVSSVTKFFDPDAPYRVNPNAEKVVNIPTEPYNVPVGKYVDINSNTVLYDPNTPVQGRDLTSLPRAGAWVYDKQNNAAVRVYQDPQTNELYLGQGGAKLEIAGVANPPNSTNVGTTTNAAVVQLQQLTTPPTVGTVISTVNSYPGNSYTVTTNPFTNNLSYLNNGGSDYMYEWDLSALTASVTNVPQDLDGIGLSLDCGGCQQFVTIMFDANATDTKAYEGISGNPPPLCYVIGVGNVNSVTATGNNGALQATDLGAVIFNGINSATKYAKGTSLPSAVDTSTTVASRHDIKLEYFAATGKIAITKSGPAIHLMNGMMGELKQTPSYKPEQTLDLQTNDKGSQKMQVVLPNTTVEALFPSTSGQWDIEPADEDYPKYPDGYPGNYEVRYKKYCSTVTQGAALTEEAWFKETWRDEVWHYPADFVNLDTKNCVLTRNRANQFIDDVDQALKYVVKSSTILGSQNSKLDFTQSNLTTASENTTASESTIRDADMARGIMDKIKSDLLVQTSQATLAKQHELTQSVLNLLQ